MESTASTHRGVWSPQQLIYHCTMYLKNGKNGKNSQSDCLIFTHWLSSGESLVFIVFVFICQTSLVIIALMFKINKILWQHMTFWANNSISPDIAGPLMRRDVVAYQMWPGHQLAFTFITRNSSITCTCTPCSTTFLSPYIATDI